MNLIIERLGDHILPYVQPLMGLLPGLWRDAEGQGLLRIQVGGWGAGDHILPYVQPLMGLLPGLWRDAEGQGLLRIQMSVCMRICVNVGGVALPSLFVFIGTSNQPSNCP